MSWIDQLQQSIHILANYLPQLLGIIGILFLVHVCNVLMQYRLNVLGIYPRKPWGLVGIVFAPWLHGDFNHVFFNSIALFALMAMMVVIGYNTFVAASMIIIFCSGLLIWLFGRNGVHVGASAVIMGYWSFTLVYGIQHPSIITVFVAIVSLYYFAGMAFSMLPGKKNESFEGHIFGAASGVVAVYALPYWHHWPMIGS
jgi:membrane associated rhomboid family serine protease